ncbi:RHS repeat-associated core domain-containing protein [Streptosporangium sandarakinum]|uniref:RHS repeat-associated core domain-containing protein n=1 Tax=Streptosporangium sandarakinum TaxID=1260955 RepID=UPI003D94E9B3
MAAVLTVVLTPGLLALQAPPVTAVTQSTVLTTNPVDTPDQMSGSAKYLPHLVDSKVTQSTAVSSGSGKSDKGKRPKDALPLENRYELTKKPAKGGLKTPPPLPSVEPGIERDEPSRQSDKDARGEVRAQATELRKASTSKTGHVLVPGRRIQTAARTASAVKKETKPALIAGVPSVSGLDAGPGTQGSGLWTFSSVTPWFGAVVTDPDDRSVALETEVEHDPSAAGQGSGLVWSDRSDFEDSGSWFPSSYVTAGKLKDGWLVRWRVRGVTSSGVVGPWSTWQSAKIDASKPSVSGLDAGPGTQGSGLWTFSSVTPWFGAVVTDPDDRSVALETEVEHDPSAAGQGSGLVWSDRSDFEDSGSWFPSSYVTAGKLKDGWLVRWRVRGVTSSGVVGPWSTWQSAKIDASKPSVSGLDAGPGTQGSGLWTFSSVTPWFGAVVTDPDDRSVALETEVEHDPSAAGQGSGLVWSDRSDFEDSGSWFPSSYVTAGKLKDGWLVRWRVRGVTSSGVVGPWSTWQSAKIDASKPSVSGLDAGPGTQGSGLWTFSSVTPWFGAVVTDPDDRSVALETEVEHDPSAAGQGSGLVWSDRSDFEDSGSWFPSSYVTAGKLKDGWLVRWRVRGVTSSGVVGPWSTWQSAKIDVNKPAGTALGVLPSTQGTGLWTISSLTPWFYTKVTSANGSASYLAAEVEYDPSAGQGSGLIWSGRGTTSYASGSNAWVQVPAAKLTDGMAIRWRVQGVTTSGVKGPWTDWQTARVDLKKPSVEGLGMNPGTRGPVSWTVGSLTPWLYAKVTDPENRASYLGIEVEHHPAATEQGTGQIYAATATTSYDSGANAWMQIPAGKLKDGWLIRWRARGVTTTGIQGPWSDWQTATVSALPFVSFSPENNTQVGTLTPTLSAHAQPVNEASVLYWFQVCSGTPDKWTWCESSPEWDKSGSWRVPKDKLAWGKTYWWFAKASTGNATTVTSSWRTFTPTPEQGTINSLLTSGTEGREFSHVAGNYTHTESDLSVPTAGSPLTVSRTYNSLDPRTDGAFGAGWTTRWDMRIDNEAQTATLLVTYPDGQQLRFAAKGDGTYAAPAGTYATLATVQEGGWRLMDKSSTSYWFDASGRLTKITDRRGRGNELTYSTDGKLAKVVATGGRSLTFAWTGGHVTSVSTDPVNGAPITWKYEYDGDKLTKVCPPVMGGACATYTYGDASRYRSLVLDAAPEGYWRLNETANATGTVIKNAAGWRPDTEEAKLAGAADATAAVPGALSGSPDTAMRFRGTANSAYVALPDATISGQGGTLAVEAWFKTTGYGTVIGYQNSVSDTPSAFTPVVYVGTDGKLRGQFYTGKSAPITSTAKVNDGTWHHAVLSGAENTQTLFLDGQAVGTLAGTITHVDQWETRIGYGVGSAAWPATTGSRASFAFNGDIDEVAVYGKSLGLGLVRAHYAARTPQPQLTTVTQASGRVWATNAYAADGGRLTSHTDRHGGTWKLSAPTYTTESSTQVLTTTTVTDPQNGTLTYVNDALRGNRPVSSTDQLGKADRYSYDTGGFPATVVDRNGNGTELSFNVRGNLLAKKTCRAVEVCSTEHFGYHLEVDNPFDPRNDQVIVSRDGRSTSATDDTYASTRNLNAYGEQTKQTSPATDDFPEGRSTVTAYTDGTEPAIGGGNTPAGLVKSAKDAKGSETTYRYTSAGDLAEQTSPSGLVTKFTYDAVGRMLTRTEVSEAHPTGATTTFAYDGLGRMLTQTGPGVKNEVTNVTHTAKITYTYDADGNKLTETLSDLTGGDPERVTTYTYDASGRTETVTDPEGGVVRTAWDTTGARVSTTDQMGVVRTFGYTKRGEPATTTLKNWTGSPVSPQPAKDVVLESRSYDPGGRLAAQVDAMGRKTSYTYFADNLLSQVIADDVKLNGSTTPTDVVLEDNVYDAAGNLTKQVKGGSKATTEYVYDAASRLTSTTFDPATLKRKTALEYDAANNITKKILTGADGNRTESTLYAYNALNQVTRQTVENGDDDLVSTSTYDDRGLLVTTTDPRGNASGATAADFTTEMRYDIAGQLVEKTSPRVRVEKTGSAADGRPTEKYGYDTAGLPTQTVDAEGRKLTSAFDKTGRLVSATSPPYTPPGGEAVTPKVGIEYDAAGRKTKVTDERGYVTSTEYDALGNPVRVTDPGPSGPGGQWVTQFDLLGEPLATIDPTGARDEATYDDLGRKITETRIERRPTTAAYTTTLTYDTAGNLTKSVTPGNKVTGYEVNAAGEVTATTDPNLNKSTVAYDLAGRTVKVTDPLKNATEAVYDLAGRQTGAKDLDATGAVVRTLGFGYDAAGNPTSSTSGEGHITRRTFDALGRMTSLVEPVSADKSITTTFGYDATGARTRLTGGRGNTTWTTYNALGLAESVIEPATAAHPSAADRTWTTLYDAAGNAVTTLQPGGVRIDRVFDHLGQVTKQTGAGATVDAPERNLTYDAVGRLTAIGDYTLEYNDRSLLTKVSKATIQVAAYAYDGLGNTTQRVDTAGTSTYTYDDASRLKTATDPVTGRTWTYDYDNADRLTSQTSADPINTQSYTYDAVYRLTSHTLKNSGGIPLSKIAYNWDKDDNLVTKTTSGTAGAGVNTYGYDHSGRLTSWTAPDGKATAYEWDDAGNRTKAGDKTFVYDERNRLLSGGGTEYTYTARGTVATETTGGATKNLVFDAFDQMVSDGDATYGYDALGRMTSRTKGTAQQRFVYSGLSNDIATVTDGVGALQAKYGRDLAGGLLSLQEGGGPALGTMTDLHGDLVGTFSGTALVDSTAYDPFGEVIQRSGTQRTLGYQGEYTDPDTGKVNMHARWYRPGSGTFASRDTATLEPNPSVQANRYTYANAGPLTGIDPTGHSTACSVSCVVNTAPSGWSGAGAASEWTFSWSDYFDEMIARQKRAADWSAPTTIGQPYISPTCCTFNGSSEADSMWWEERFGDYANPALWCSEAEARKSKLLPNCRPMPEGMEGTFWGAPESVQKKFLLKYNIEQMYSTDVDDAYILASWVKLLPSSPMAAGPAPGIIDPWAQCKQQFSAKKCDQWRKAADLTVVADQFRKNCLTPAGIKKNGDSCNYMMIMLGMDPKEWSDKIVEGFKDTALFKVLDFFVGDAIACRSGNIGSCILMATDLAGGAAGKGLKYLGKAASKFEKAAGAAAASCRRGCDWAKVSGIVRDASKGKGNFNLGTGTIAEANQAGAAWVGKGYKVVKKKNGEEIWISSDGQRQYRLPSYKPKWGNYQANFEWRTKTSGEWQGNGHLHIKD